MRIIAGKHRGRRLVAPEGRAVRPTSDRVRAAVFNILDHWSLSDQDPPVAGARVLDACCGSGALGLEALSRGASHCTFLDSSPVSLAVTVANIRSLGEDGRADPRRADATDPPPAVIPCSLVFCDPPYRSGLATPILAALLRRHWVGPGAVAVVEIARGEPEPQDERLVLLDRRGYGETEILIFNVPRG